jgi:methionyl-tRNA formyltransferase
MKIIFAGTPEFAALALEALLEARQQIVLVLTQPDRPAGRGMKSLASPVKQLALRHGIEVAQPAKLKDVQAQEALRVCGADAMVVAAYGLILPQAVLDIPRLGAINIHASLLPRWRGAAPIQRALLAGDRETGVCIMRMDAGLDTGPVLLREALPISADDTAQTLHDRLAALGARLIVRAMEGLEQGVLTPQQQATEGINYAHKIDKAEARIDWTEQAEAIDRHIRAFSPFPGAHSMLRAAEIKIWNARPEADMNAAFPDALPGQVLAVGADGLRVACGKGTLNVLQLQRPGGKRLPVADFLRGFAVAPGDRFGL